MSVNFCKVKLRHIPEDGIQYTHRPDGTQYTHRPDGTRYTHRLLHLR